MKVLFLTNYPSPYRVEFFNQIGKQIDLTVSFTSTPKGQLHRNKNWFNEEYKYFTPVFLNSKNFFGRKIALDIIGLLKNKYDFIIFAGCTFPSFSIAMSYLIIKKIPYYIEYDGGLINNESKIQYRIRRYYISRASGWFSSGNMTNKYLRHYGADPKKIFNYPFTSIKKDDILPELLSKNDKLKFKKKLNMKEEYILLSVGQFIYRKGYDILLKAMKSIDKSVGLYIVGGKPTQEYIDLKESSDRIHFIDFKPKDELAEYYMAADIFVLPTREDTWGLVVNEALSYGLPVISTDHCVAGMDLIRTGKNGFIVPSENCNALIKGINSVLTSNLDIMRHEAFNSIKDYTIENMVSRHIDIFNQIKNK